MAVNGMLHQTNEIGYQRFTPWQIHYQHWMYYKSIGFNYLGTAKGLVARFTSERGRQIRIARSLVLRGLRIRAQRP